MPVRPSARARAAHLGPERRRPLVLDAALEVFVEHGFAGTSMEMIAQAAGVTRPVVYDCFPNKSVLFAALLEREQQRLIEQVLAALPAEPDFDDVESLMTGGFTALLRAAASAPSSWRLLFMGEHGSHPDLVRRGAAGRQFVIERIAQLAAMTLPRRGVKGDVGRLSRLVAHLLVGQGEAAVRLMLTGPDEWTPEELGALLGRQATLAEQAIVDRSTGATKP